MTRVELNYIKDAFSQIIDDIAGNPDWHEAAKAVASDLGTLERKLEEKISPLPSNLDEAAEEYYDEMWDELGGIAMVRNNEHDIWYPSSVIETVFKAGAEWNTGHGWIDDGSMPPETKHEEDTMQGHREWTESEPVLAWDSMYGPRVDFTRDGKWMSEQTGGYTGQVCHGIVAWMLIPKYKEKQ